MPGATQPPAPNTSANTNTVQTAAANGPPMAPPLPYDNYHPDYRHFYLPPPYAYHPPGYHHEYHANAPSSDPIEELDDVELYPLMRDWLVSIDNSPHGKDGQNFQQHVSALTCEGFRRIQQLVDETVTIDVLLACCQGLTRGDGTLLLGYAKKDVAAIRLAETKRVKRDRLQPKHYPAYV